MKFELSEDFINDLKDIAMQDNPSHNPKFDIVVESCDNPFTAYEMGRQHAENDMAQWILSVLNVD